MPSQALTFKRFVHQPWASRPNQETTLKTFKLFRRTLLATAAVVALAAHAGEVEVLHYWTSGGEAKSAPS